MLRGAPGLLLDGNNQRGCGACAGLAELVARTSCKARGLGCRLCRAVRAAGNDGYCGGKLAVHDKGEGQAMEVESWGLSLEVCGGRGQEGIWDYEYVRVRFTKRLYRVRYWV